MNAAILKAYQDELNARAKADGTKPRLLTADEERVGDIAAKFSEADLRLAVVMRASYERPIALAAKKAKAAAPAVQEAQA